jgi:hypothetical protein
MYFIDCWNNEPDNRPIINQVITKLSEIALNHERPFNNSSHEELPQVIQNFNKMSTNEIETSILKNNQVIRETILSENNFDKIIDEIVVVIGNFSARKQKREILNYLNNHNVNSQKIYKWLLNNQNQLNSIILLGVFSHFGIGSDVNMKKAFELYRKAANLGNAFVMTNLGYCYERGIGTNVNVKKAFELYQKAANLGYAFGIYSLGYCYMNGIGTRLHEEKAFELYQKAANLGNLNGINGLGHCYDNGIGTVIDKRKAVGLYLNAANLGSSTAQYNLGLMHEYGMGITENMSQATYWFKKSAEQGNKDAQIKLIEIS